MTFKMRKRFSIEETALLYASIDPAEVESVTAAENGGWDGWKKASNIRAALIQAVQDKDLEVVGDEVSVSEWHDHDQRVPITEIDYRTFINTRYTYIDALKLRDWFSSHDEHPPFLGSQQTQNFECLEIKRDGFYELAFDLQSVIEDMEEEILEYREAKEIVTAKALETFRGYLERVLADPSTKALQLINERSEQAAKADLLEKEILGLRNSLQQSQHLQQQLNEAQSRARELESQLAQIQSSQESDQTAPFHTNTSPKMRLLIEANDLFWKDYVEEDRKTAPTKRDVTDWLTSRLYGPELAKTADTILRDGRHRPGGKKIQH